jgi:hypothetical protein
LLCLWFLSACGNSSSSGSSTDSSVDIDIIAFSDDWPEAGSALVSCDVPSDGMEDDSSSPDQVVGDGTAASCTSDAFVAAVAAGGVITFDCGSDPVTIELDETAQVYNEEGEEIVIDGGGLVTLSGQGERRILYMNTCDAGLNWSTDHCQNQDYPHLTVQNLTFSNGASFDDDPAGGGAIYVSGGRFKIFNCRFFNNYTDETGPDVGGAAVRVLSQYNDEPVYVVNSTFGGSSGLGNIGSNGGALSSIGVSFSVYNSLMSYNEAIGNGANSAEAGTPGGGSGGAIYNDGNDFTLNICGSEINNNIANEGGGAIFFVSNDLTGDLYIEDSVLQENTSDGFETSGYPGIFVLADDIEVTNSTIE